MRRVALGAAVLVLLTACAGVPHSGVRTVATDPQSAADAFVHMRAPGREPGLSPRAVVTRFLAASGGFDEGFATAREFLTPAADGRWTPGAGELVFDTLTAVEGDPAAEDQVFTGKVVAVVSPDGHYRTVEDPQPATLTFHLVSSGTGASPTWSIDGLVSEGGGVPVGLGSGVLLDRLGVSHSMAPLDLWWPNRSLTALVPEPVLLPRGVGDLATVLTDRLAGEPGPALRRAVLPAVPPGVRVEIRPAGTGAVSVVPSGDGVLSEVRRRAMQAAYVRTLTQDSLGIDKVLLGPGVTDITDSPASFDGGTSAPLRTLLAVDEADRAVEVDVPQQPDSAPTPVAALAGEAVRHPTRSRTGGGDRYAALSSDGRRLLVTDDTGTPQVVLTGRRAVLSAPSIDASGTTWTLDRTTGTLYAYARGEAAARPVPLPSLPAGWSVVNAEPSPDGARVALVLQQQRGKASSSQLVVAAVEPQQPVEGGAALRLGDTSPFATSALSGSVLDLDWADPAVLSVLVSATTGSTLLQVPVGQLVKQPGPLVLATAVQVAVPSTSQTKLPVVYQDAKGTLLQGSAGRRLGSKLHDPSYAG
ncbi:hypothetical protein CLV35_2813 [Motilibacter peucedani]|uniref:Lipoprotein LpqB N-terminal domain-containing protein n=1 Tax=Motilibacter peucedani TaxID=598650 RepID=A0A420XMS2_9ACTN|nr:hypothetical protein [Motilibacter peucedani]RKS72566.1 hypothetical protein CLV35_2813 [Motilibacter peucedani]